MAKGTEKNKTNAMLNQAQGQQANYTTDYLSRTAPERATARSNANDMYSTMYGGYSDIAKNGGVSPELLASLRGGGTGGGGGGGGAAAPNYGAGGYGDVSAAYKNFMGGGGVNLAENNYAMSQLHGLASSGGWDPSRIASMDSNIAGLKDIGKTGGLTDEAIARMRGNGVYDEFAKTGGYDDAQQTAYRQRATAGIPAQYQTAMDTANRMSGITGNYNPAAIAQMARSSAYDTNRAATDAEASLQDSIRSGRLAGAQGVSSNEQNIQGLMSSNKLAGLQGAGSMEANMLNSIAQNRTSAATGLSGADIGGQELVQRGKMFGTQGLEGIADKEAAAQRAAASAASANAANNAANEKWLANFQTDNRLAGLGGLGNLYTSSPAEVGYYDTAQRQMMGQNTGQTVDVSQARMANNPQRDWASTIGGLVGSAAGAMTGIGALGGIGKATKSIGGMGSSGMAGLWG
jgi:hypothetical protein